ncbi:NUDIX domain-containing protein [Comamonas sp. lk]|uniref:NUDIX hydrolase n=1 Tax=Comamonas sp. lk TaxID=2201272 RepID=UPI000EAF5D86|nr:NUDIX domain-containing protein [Comamonas sp. lk]
MNQSPESRMSPIVSVDVVLLTLVEQVLHAVLLRRAQAPFAGVWALPGGYIHTDEDADAQASAARVLREKVGITGAYLEQLASFTGPARDPRGWSVAIAYCALLPVQQLPAEHADISVIPVTALPQLPFDHRAIVDAALERVRNKSLYSSLPVHLCGESFTLPQLQQVYESILGEPLNKVSFRRKMDEMELLQAVPGAMHSGGAHRPAQLYRVKPAFRQTLALAPRGL